MARALARIGIGLLALATATLGAGPALADAKAGIDAWKNGDYHKAVEIWRPAAIAGDADAQFDLAEAYKLGRGVPVDFGLAEEWFGKAARQGHSQAEINFGLALFQNGKRDEALPWLRKGVERGDWRSQLVLGTMLFNGEVVEKDWPRAYALVTRAAASGAAPATKALSQMDNYIPANVRQQGVLLVGQYTSSSQTQTALDLEAEQPAGGMRRADLPPSSVAGDAATTPIIATNTAAPRPAQHPPRAVTPQAVHHAAPEPAIIGKGWRFQVGAFRDEGNAHALWKQLQTRVSALSTARSYYIAAAGFTRLQVGPFATKAEATSICGVVRARMPSTPCVPIAP
ncbi:MAG: SPOR domain-containing protein [Sphingomonas sp.]